MRGVCQPFTAAVVQGAAHARRDPNKARPCRDLEEVKDRPPDHGRIHDQVVVHEVDEGLETDDRYAIVQQRLAGDEYVESLRLVYSYGVQNGEDGYRIYRRYERPEGDAFHPRQGPLPVDDVGDKCTAEHGPDDCVPQNWYQVSSKCPFVDGQGCLEHDRGQHDSEEELLVEAEFQAGKFHDDTPHDPHEDAPRHLR
eukprot:CAMPEP_0194306690 /NCGR_PEP_ID=MMETSP0171-20130528/3744_1 /TAXON_ID=218684 /ORGANISM="Corethron pennatum, Strain L29A3" /LENGTH=196 /DNA_ID=CAMNT_0039058519 /DNA_START=314 /DNA_END=903 /DNA_ORIENTATION=-